MAVVVLAVVVCACKQDREPPAPAPAPAPVVAGDARGGEATSPGDATATAPSAAVVDDRPHHHDKPEVGPACCCLVKQPKDPKRPLEMMTAQRCEEAGLGTCQPRKSCLNQDLEREMKAHDHDIDDVYGGSSL